MVAALTQDAVFPAQETAWRPRERRFAVLLNRFRWEEQRPPPARARPLRPRRWARRWAWPRTAWTARRTPCCRCSTVELRAEGHDGAGHVLLTLAGDGAIRVAVEAIDVHLRDVTRPYEAPSGKVPEHG